MTPPLPPPPAGLTPDEVAAAAPVVRVLGHRMALHPPARDRYVSPVLARHGVYEPFLTELMANEVRAGDVALDLGAHVGYHTLLLARLVGPGGRVFALEPDPANFALLKRNVAMNGYAHVSLFPLAAAEGCGRRQLYLSPDNAGDHRLHAAEDERPAVGVEAVSVDWLFRDRAGGADFVKLDVQGCEGAAVDGMAGLIGRSPRLAMLLEFWPLGLERAGYGAGRLLDRMSAWGFRVYEVDERACGVRRADPGQLLERYPAAAGGFVNLWCVKAPPHAL